MLVVMLKDLEKVGVRGQLVTVSPGFASNFLIPKGLARAVSSKEAPALKNQEAGKQVKKEVLKSRIAMVGSVIENMTLTISKKVHDNKKLYAAVSEEDISEALTKKLAERGGEEALVVSKKQVDITKSIKEVGEHKVIIKLNAKIKPELTVKITQAK